MSFFFDFDKFEKVWRESFGIFIRFFQNYSAFFSCSITSLVGKVFFSTVSARFSLSLLNPSTPSLKALCSASKRIAKKERHKLINYLFVIFLFPSNYKSKMICFFGWGSTVLSIMELKGSTKINWIMPKPLREKPIFLNHLGIIQFILVETFNSIFESIVLSLKTDS